MLAAAQAEGLVRREELFVATKLSDAEAHAGYDGTRQQVLRQLKLLQVDYIDLYMYDLPGVFPDLH